MSGKKTKEWLGEPLPRGRHGLGAAAVRTSQRARLHHAMLDLVSRQGYAATTVPQVVASARVSRNAFYEFFADKEACFLAACEEDAGRLMQEIAAVPRERDWRRIVDGSLAVYLRWWQARPQLTRAYFVEMPGAGPLAVKHRAQVYAPFEEMFRTLAAYARSSDSGLSPLADYIPRMLALSITEYVAAEVRAHGSDRLLDLHADLNHYIIKLLGNDTAAKQVHRRKRA
ncbi:MAG: TetR family transcriptional regulator [Nevskia sp.]|nr:TetR family transcriptional regulator [Nevskia sp.]